MTRIRGLDALRFLCALCVVQGHLRLGGYWVLDRLSGPHDLINYIRVAFNQGMPIPTGPNAVIVFFVISGFCIHFPHRNRGRFDARQFLVRRYIRIGLPAVVAAVLLYNTGFTALQDSVLWSIICEIIYYTLYPLLMAVRYRLGWPTLIAASYAAAYAVVIVHQGGPYNGNFTAYGVSQTWILGLPCWLLGCLLAESHARFRAYGRPLQWGFRLAVISIAAIGTTLRFYSGIGYYWSEPLLGIVVFFWLGTEIAYFTRRRPLAWLEWCGAWSYSVYLYHAPISVFVAQHLVPQLEVRTRLLVEVSAVVAASYILYCLVERPSHLLARRYAGAFKRAARPGAVPTQARGAD